LLEVFLENLRISNLLLSMLGVCIGRTTTVEIVADEGEDVSCDLHLSIKSCYINVFIIFYF